MVSAHADRLGVGMPARELALFTDEGVCALSSLGDAPTVVVFVERTPSMEGAIDVAALEAHLRPLGVELLVLSGVLSAVFVVERRVVRFAHATPTPHELPATLFDAVRAAQRALEVERRPTKMSRRDCILASLVAGFALAFGDACAGKRPEPATPSAGTVSGDGDIPLSLHVNGSARAVRVDSRTSLLDALRERMGLTGTKKGCDHGQCGACTVLIDGRRVCSCLTLAVMAQGTKITTIEGLADGDRLHPVQAAFVATDGLQCGYCTPGQIMSAVGLLAEGKAHTDDEVREQMSGNLCRCGAYPNIVAAVQLARKQAS